MAKKFSFVSPLLAAILFMGLCITQVYAAPPGKAKGKDGFSGRLSVMTQNLYVGSNLFQILGGTPGDVPANAAKIFSDIQITDFEQRADAIAELVAKNRPHLIGLQEVSLIRTQCPTDILPPPGETEPNATDVYADYLQLFMDALAARGLDYEVATSVMNADVELPAETQDLLDCPAPYFDARLTDYDVVLHRSDVEVTWEMSNNYTYNFPVPTPAGEIIFYRGYNIVDVNVKGRSYRFVNTHLEVDDNAYSRFFQFAQASELTQTLDGLAHVLEDELLVVVGDLNSDPVDGAFVECYLPPAFTELGMCPTPYAVMAASGYVDTWTVRNGAYDPGYTCCQQDLLLNPESWLDRRIDHVWVRPPLAGAQGPNFLKGVKADVVGDRQKDKSVDGLWPSDHAGVVVDMTLRQKK